MQTPSFAPQAASRRRGAPALPDPDAIASDPRTADHPASIPLAREPARPVSTNDFGHRPTAVPITVADPKRRSRSELHAMARELGCEVAPEISKHDLLFAVQRRMLDAGDTLEHASL